MLYSNNRIYICVYIYIYNIYKCLLVYSCGILVSQLRVCLSAAGSKDVSWPQLSLLQGWGSLSIAFTGKFMYKAHYFILLRLDPFELSVDREVIVCTPPPFCRGRRVEPPIKFSKKGGLTGPQPLEGSCWERGGDFFQGEWLEFSHKK